MLFDQLQAVHHLPQQARVQLESGALLHDVGHRVSHRGHHKHGEYLALNGDIPGLEGRDRSMVGALVRYQQPQVGAGQPPSSYSALNNNDKRIARRLAAILRIAEGWTTRIASVLKIFARRSNAGGVTLQVHARGDATEDLRDAQRSADLFEKEFHVQVYFRRPQPG